MTARRHLVLAGAGHAQLDLLSALRRGMPAGWQVSLVTPHPDFQYSGLLPAVVAGTVPAEAASIPVTAIARVAGVQVHLASVVALDAGARTLALSSGERLAYDLLSLDVGSVPAGLGVPGAREFAFAMRPFPAALGLMARLEAEFRQRARGEAVTAVVVGAGAAGLEIAMAIRTRIRSAGCRPVVTIVDAGARDGLPLPGWSDPARAVAARVLQERDIAVLAGSVTAVTARMVTVVVNGRERHLESTATAWVTGPAAHPWLAASGLACDAAGYPLAGPTLALDDAATVFGGGDCVALRDAPATAKAGVYAVRMAPVLAANVLAVARGGLADARFVPQADFLALLSTGDGQALLRWRGVTLQSRWAHGLKAWIDGHYLRRYRALAP